MFDVTVVSCSCVLQGGHRGLGYVWESILCLYVRKRGGLFLRSCARMRLSFLVRGSSDLLIGGGLSLTQLSMLAALSAKHLVRGEPNVSYICSRYYRAPELIFGATDYTSQIGERGGG